MGFRIGSDEEVKSEPNVVPLCDVLLVLLIIFMVVTPLVQRGLDVKLPTALNTINMPDNPEVVLTLRKDGGIYINEEKTTMENLQTVLEEEFLTVSDKKLYLKADQEIAFGNIIEIIEVLKEVGVEVLGIITEKKAEKSD
ncbi:MAG: biopolymer transporter ExbD [Candidatus Aminicenantes bacterium]|nr:biopolymer transporter ExbD [Candidatus Aminicenantes bacterium]